MEKDIQHANFWDEAVPAYIRENFVLINDSEEGTTKKEIDFLNAKNNFYYPIKEDSIINKTIILPTND